MREVILSIETSCDETSVAVVADGLEVLANVISSQIDVHQAYGGVVPELASRQHIENISLVVQDALEQAKLQLRDITAVAVTHGPGLVGALLVGLCYAKGLAYSRGIPLIGVHHLEAHVYANFLLPEPPRFPFVCLVVSGGHTDIVHVEKHGHYHILGRTRDDAAGEAFDKIARVIGLPYPGGPHMERLALQGQPTLNFPRAWLEEASYDFSFSGLKSAVLNYINNSRQKGQSLVLADVAASFQEAVVEVLVAKTVAAARAVGAKSICLAGGVSANKRLRQAMSEAAARDKVRLYLPEFVYCTDNAAMVGAVAYYRLRENLVADLSLNAHAVLPMSTWTVDKSSKLPCPNP